MKRELVTQAVLYILCTTLVSTFWQRPMVLSLCLIMIAAFMIYRWHEKSDLLFFFVAFLLGPAGEASAVYFGAWKYAQPIYLIPIWLPFLWGAIALFLKRLCETLLVKQ
jgi:hypothetical protein